MQAKSLIQTKLKPPTLSSDILPRPHLIQQLENGRLRKLTLISAPAGYGKSVLAGIWQKICDRPVVWLSLDKNDNDLGVFLSYVVTSIQTILPDTYQNTTTMLNGLQLPPVDVLATSLVNETIAVSRPFLLFLDDYHLIHNPDIHQLIDTCIQYQSANMHLVLITRQDPPLDIVNLRAKNQVTEIRLADLRFNEAEAQQYLNRQLRQDDSPELVHQLFHYTEGWVVGLRLAALALRNPANQARLLETYQGANQYIMSYLVSEVLAQQPQPVKTFLLATSLLDRFCAPLCDALLKSTALEQQTSSQKILEQLYQKNMFLIPLDHQNEWFRYHHLFQDLLQQQLRTAVTDTQINQLHIQASDWLAQQGFIEEALEHALSANNTQQAIQIVAQARYRLMNATEWQRLQQLIRRFPRAVIDNSPDLLIAETWLCYHQGQLTRVPILLAQLTQLLDETAVDPENETHLMGEINVLLSILSYFTVDIDSIRTQAEQSLTQIAPELWGVRILARLMLALAQQMAGDLRNAYATMFSNFVEESEQSNQFKAITLVTSGVVEFIAADTVSMKQNATQALTLCQDEGASEMIGYAHNHLGTVAYLQNDFSTAEEHFTFVHKRPYSTYGENFVPSSCGLALIYQARGQEQEARDVVEAALAFFLATGNPQLLLLMKAFQAELALQQGQLSIALQWAAQFDSPPPLLPMYHFYAPQFTLVNIWLAENTSDSRKKAADLLVEIKTFLEFTHNAIFMIDTLALQAVMYQADGNEALSMTTLEEALTLALPGSIIRPFINLGQAIGQLLDKLPAPEPELVAFKTRILTALTPATNQLASLQENNDLQPLPEPLTNRELDILTLLTQRQTYREIAQELLISPHTVHSHIKNIYSKLNVNNRRQAADCAIELGLVTPD